MKKLIYLTGFFILLSVSPTFAQGCEDDDSATTGTENVDPSKPTVKLFGFFQPQYGYNFDGNDNENSFYFKRARIGALGRITNDFSYYFLLEASPFINSDGNVKLLDAFITYKKYDWAKISVGSFKQPFGLEVTQACNNLTTIDRAIVSDQLVAPQRDMGLMVLGGSKKTQFRYALALMNGRGLYVKDNNAKKDIIGRASYKLFDWAQIGGSFRYGYPNNMDDDRTTYGLDVVLKHENFKLQGEYIYDEGDYNRAAGGGCGTTPLELGDERHGAYGMLSYRTDFGLEPVVKYEYFDADSDIKSLGYQEMVTIGANYFFNKNTRFQINYQLKTEGANSIDNDALLMQMQVRF